MKCSTCNGSGWVCERHPDREWEGDGKPEACSCGAPGMQCLNCKPCGCILEPGLPNVIIEACAEHYVNWRRMDLYARGMLDQELHDFIMRHTKPSRDLPDPR
jgi:hypothetical protein